MTQSDIVDLILELRELIEVATELGDTVEADTLNKRLDRLKEMLSAIKEQPCDV